MTSTSLRPFRWPNFTLPVAVANSVSSPPRPTFSPGWIRVPRWRTMIVPALMAVPSKTFTPRRLDCESRPFLVEPAPLVLDMSVSPTLADAGDLDGGVPLAVAPAARAVGFVLVGEARDLGALRLTHDLGGDLGLAQGLGPRQHLVAVDQEDGRELDLAVVAGADQLHRELLALLDPILLATALDDCVHAICLVMWTGQPTGPLPRAATQRFCSRNRSPWQPFPRTKRGLPPQSGSSPLSTRTPRPSHSGQRSANDSNRPSPMRLRVISHRPSSEMSNTWVRVLSRDSASRNTRTTWSRLSLRSMSMKSTTMMPPMSRSRSWRAISTAASRLFLNTVSSRLERPTFLPVLTSMTVSASVRSMMSDPPEGSHTLRSSMRTLRYSWLNSSRMTRTAMSGSR